MTWLENLGEWIEVVFLCTDRQQCVALASQIGFKGSLNFSEIMWTRKLDIPVTVGCVIIEDVWIQVGEYLEHPVLLVSFQLGSIPRDSRLSFINSLNKLASHWAKDVDVKKYFAGPERSGDNDIDRGCSEIFFDENGPGKIRMAERGIRLPR